MDVNPLRPPINDTDASRTPGEATLRRVRQVTILGLAMNLLLSGIKFVGGWAAASEALIADAVHSLSDGVTDVAVIVGSYYWSRPPDKCHPYGHRRIETLVTIIIGGLLLAAGLGIGWDAIRMLGKPHTRVPGAMALWIAALAIVTKEVLYRWTVREGKQLKSSALAANAWHHRLDAASSIPALLAIAGARLFPAWSFLDPVGAIVVCLFIIQAAVKIILPGVREFIDTGAPQEIYDDIRTIAYQHPAVRQVHGMRTRYLGSGLQVDLHLVVDGNITVSQGHDIAKRVKRMILADGPNVHDVIVHVEPLEAAMPGESLR